jgi:hypothetical protein
MSNCNELYECYTKPAHKWVRVWYGQFEHFNITIIFTYDSSPDAVHFVLILRVELTRWTGTRVSDQSTDPDRWPLVGCILTYERSCGQYVFVCYFSSSFVPFFYLFFIRIFPCCFLPFLSLITVSYVGAVVLSHENKRSRTILMYTQFSVYTTFLWT